MDIEALAKGIGVQDVKVIDAFNVKELRAGLRDSLERPEVSTVIVRGACAMQVRERANPRKIDKEKCDQCGVCLRLGCAAIQTTDGQAYIGPALCAGDACGICEQLCPQKAISI